MKRLIVLTFFFIIIFNQNSFSHVNHYNKIKYLKYNLFLNNELIGYHTFNFNFKGEILEVKGEGMFKVSKLGIDLMDYKTISVGKYKKNRLIKFNSKTQQNKKNKYVNIDLINNHLNIDGSSYNGKTDKNSVISSLWNHEIVTKKKQISSVSGRIIDQSVKFLGKKEIFINNEPFEALNFHIYSNDNKPMNEKKLNIKIWYDKETLLWLKASYEKFGKWEYRISEVKY